MAQDEFRRDDPRCGRPIHCPSVCHHRTYLDLRWSEHQEVIFMVIGSQYRSAYRSHSNRSDAPSPATGGRSADSAEEHRIR